MNRIATASEAPCCFTCFAATAFFASAKAEEPVVRRKTALRDAMTIESLLTQAHHIRARTSRTPQPVRTAVASQQSANGR